MVQNSVQFANARVFPCNFSLADLTGAPGTRAPLGSKFFQFHTVLGKNWPNNSFSHPILELVHPLMEILDPPLIL